MRACVCVCVCVCTLVGVVVGRELKYEQVCSYECILFVHVHVYKCVCCNVADLLMVNKNCCLSSCLVLNIWNTVSVSLSPKCITLFIHMCLSCSQMHYSCTCTEIMFQTCSVKMPCDVLGLHHRSQTCTSSPVSLHKWHVYSSTHRWIFKRKSMYIEESMREQERERELNVQYILYFLFQ